MYYFGLGVTGAALSTVISQYVIFNTVSVNIPFLLSFANEHILEFLFSDTLSPF